jgi:hypothetical protein
MPFDLQDMIQLIQLFMLREKLRNKGKFTTSLYNKFPHRVYFDNSAYELFCEVCDSHVQNSSKHCGQCNRCVDGFDHHCRWLNNCIGKSNYQYFFRVICSFFLMSVLHNATDAAVLFYLDSADSYLLKNQNIKVSY